MEVEQLQDCKVSRKPEDLLKGEKLAKQSFQKMFERIQVGKIQLGKILFGKIQFGKYSFEKYNLGKNTTLEGCKPSYTSRSI